MKPLVYFLLFTLFISTSANIDQSYLSCSVCETIVGKFNDTLENKFVMTALRKVLETECSTLGPLSKPCEYLADSLVDIIADIPEDLELLGYESPTDVCSALSFCTVNCCSSTNLPEQVHLSYGNSLEEMTITFATLDNIDTFAQIRSINTNEYMRIPTRKQTYNHGGWIGWIHYVTFPVSPNTSYVYVVGSDTYGWTNSFEFTTYDPSKPFKAIVIGDMGATSDSDNNIALITKWVNEKKIDAVLHIGDISYANGVQRTWDLYFRKIEPFASRVPYMVICGNHELPFNFSAYKTRFVMPQREFDNMMWWLDLDNLGVRFIATSTESIYNTPQVTKENLELLRKLLQENKRNIWMGHRPLWCTTKTSDCQNDAEHLRELLEKLLQKYTKVAITAHVHNYERLENGIPYIVNGAGGNREKPDPVTDNPPFDSKVRYSGFGIGLLTIEENSIKWEFFDEYGNQKDNVVF